MLRTVVIAARYQNYSMGRFCGLSEEIYSVGVVAFGFFQVGRRRLLEKIMSFFRS